MRIGSPRHRRTRAGPRLSYQLGDLIQVFAGELDGAGVDPAVHLLRRTGADDGAADPGPRQGPGDGDARDRSPVPLGDRSQPVAEREIAAELRAEKVGRATPP